MALVKVLPKGQITLPKMVRDRLGIAKGDHVLLEIVDDREVRLRALPRRTTLLDVGQLVRAQRLLDDGVVRRAIEEGRRGAGHDRARVKLSSTGPQEPSS
ncbi:AbrB/MazE/SpoVT family DNA-binding domain-containing protein [Thermaerobacter subterraneus]|uniref:AbrB/MazE/SpoVT family DNA-binding domain-containing protein n=1 Tax=Thermaerobacter subterraneus TaxID=175696 RepID=UPI001FA7180A|nr:AbrB/MazE/SpoVT family DNA-binding domain-containing protein [Thermaerobacter subterraneus]